MIGSGLSTNPFSAARFAPGALPWLGDEPDEIARLFAQASVPRGCQQVLGDHGTGKSTLLVHLEAHGRRAGATVVRFRGSHGLPLRALASLWRSPGPRLVLVDEVEELGALRRSALRTVVRLQNTALVVSTHRDLGIPTLARRRVDAVTARRVVELLVGAGSGVVPCLASLEERLARHGGNLREVLFELYDETEPRPSPGVRSARQRGFRSATRSVVGPLPRTT